MKKLEKWEQENLARLLDAIGEEHAEYLTDGERQTLAWLAGWEKSTIDNMCSILAKQRNNPPFIV